MPASLSMTDLMRVMETRGPVGLNHLALGNNHETRRDCYTRRSDAGRLEPEKPSTAMDFRCRCHAHVPGARNARDAADLPRQNSLCDERFLRGSILCPAQHRAREAAGAAAQSCFDSLSRIRTCLSPLLAVIVG